MPKWFNHTRRFIESGLVPAQHSEHELHVERIIGRADHRVVGKVSVIAERLKKFDDFVDGHVDNYQCNVGKSGDVRVPQGWLAPGNQAVMRSPVTTTVMPGWAGAPVNVDSITR
jgi:hypothetical protein